LFVKIEKKTENSITIRRKGYGVSLRIPKPLREKYFPERKLNIYVDRENKLLGLQPRPKGVFKIYSDGTVWSSELTRYRIKPGTYRSNWSEEHGMLIIEVEFE